MIELKIDIVGLNDVIRRIELVNSMGVAPLMRGIAGIMGAAVAENFQKQGRPKWVGLKPLVLRSAPGAAAGPGRQVSYTTIKRTGDHILKQSGRLESSITQYSDAHTAMAGTNLIYAGVHNFGYKTKAHVILPRNVSALKFGNTFAKVVNHPGSNIPKREFLMLTQQDEQDISDLGQQYFRNLILPSS